MNWRVPRPAGGGRPNGPDRRHQGRSLLRRRLRSRRPEYEAAPQLARAAARSPRERSQASPCVLAPRLDGSGAPPALRCPRRRQALIAAISSRTGVSRTGK